MKLMSCGTAQRATFGVVHGDDTPWGGRPASAELTLPPLAGLWLVPE